MNIGIIGFGKMGKIRANIVSSYGYSKNMKIFDPIYKSENKDYCYVKRYEEIIKSSEIDVLFICTPNYLNKELTIEGLKKESIYFVRNRQRLHQKM